MSEPKLIPQAFQAQPNSIATYNYTDIAEGTGFVIYYFGTGTDENLLRSSAFYSNAISTYSSYGSGIDLDFDVEFNLPQTISGKAIVNLNAVLGNDAAGSGGTSGNITIYIRKWDGSTETEIANNVSDQFIATIGTSDEKMLCIEIDVPKTHFKRGDSLRITISANTQSSPWKWGVGHDPKGRVDPKTLVGGNGTNNITTAEAHIPFKLKEIGY